MSIEDLPKHYHGGSVRLSPKERKKLEEWVIQEGWTREKSINKQFDFDESMPRNLVAPGIPPEHWGGNGKMVCVMCGYVTTVTNLHRDCFELPADEPIITFRYCHKHKVNHKNETGWTTHRTIAMVCIS